MGFADAGWRWCPAKSSKIVRRCRERHRLTQRRRNRNLTDAERAARNARSNRSYHRTKDAPKLPAQGELPLDHVPRVVAAHGLRAAHPKPLVSLGKVPGRPFTSYRVSPAQAWHFPEIELARAGSSIAALVLDCDHPKAMARGMADLPPPNWTVWRTANSHCHPAWALATPVHRYPQARPKPLLHLARIGDYYTETLGADAGYSGVLVHNPAPVCRDDAFRTAWGREEPYSLDQLAAVIPFGWQAPAVRQTGVGRNVDLFEAAMRWAGRRENAHLPVLTALIVANQKLDPYPLPDSEIAATARKIEAYRKRWSARGWHCPTWIARQSARGVKSGKVRRAGSNEALKPWEAEGIGRTMWYRRRARDPGNEELPPLVGGLEPTQIRAV